MVDYGSTVNGNGPFPHLRTMISYKYRPIEMDVLLLPQTDLPVSTR